MSLPQSYHEKAGVQFRAEGSAQVPAAYQDTTVEVLLLRSDAVWIDRSARGRIAITGPDRATFLQALFTNDVLGCGPGQGIYGAFLNRHGRMTMDARVLVLEDKLLLDVEPQSREAALAHLDKYHFTEKLALHDETEQTTHLSIFGPRSRDLFPLLFNGAPLSAELGITSTQRDEKLVLGVGNGLSGEPGFDLIFDSRLNEAITEQLASLRVQPIGWDALEVARVEAGNVRYGVELTDTTIPLEAGLRDRAISFTKGCYPGQEIIARMDSRGTPARRLVGFLVEGQPGHALAPGTEIRKGERPVGSIMSCVDSPSLKGRTVAMGYVKKDIEDTEQDLYAGDRKVWIVPRPFYPPRH